MMVGPYLFWMVGMLFCLSVCDQDQRAILDDSLHGDLLAVIEAESWIEAREEALKQKEMDPFIYRAGQGWLKREESGML